MSAEEVREAREERDPLPEALDELDRTRWILAIEQIARASTQALLVQEEMKRYVANKVLLKGQLAQKYRLGPKDDFDPVTGAIKRG